MNNPFQNIKNNQFIDNSINRLKETKEKIFPNNKIDIPIKSNENQNQLNSNFKNTLDTQNKVRNIFEENKRYEINTEMNKVAKENNIKGEFH